VAEINVKKVFEVQDKYSFVPETSSCRTKNMTKKRRRQKGSAMTRAIKGKKLCLSTPHLKINEVRKTLKKHLAELKTCVGPQKILRFKVLTRAIDKLNRSIQTLETHSQEFRMHEMMAEIDNLNSVHRQNESDSIVSSLKVIKVQNRLYPAVKHKRNVFDSMEQRDIDKWKNMRSYKKRYSVMFGKHVGNRINHVDLCRKCGVDCIVDKEHARSVCTQCGDCRVFASHIFDTKEVEKDEGILTRQQSLSHMQKFSAQFERGYPCAPLDVLEKMYIQYNKFHFRDPSKVQSCRTAQLMKSCPSISKIYKRAPDRISKELKAESVPEFSSQEINSLLNQRNRLRLPEEIASENAKPKKSFNNQIYMRQLGRANGIEPSRLFPQAKTCKIHIERCRGLEQECLIQQRKYGGDNFVVGVGNNTNVQDSKSAGSGMIWSLKPFS
jgi:hypothetical protein